MARLTHTPDERKARMDAAHAELTAAVEAISSSDDWRAFLDFARKLHSYSAQNRMWLFQQAMMRGWDDLGHVAGFRTWLTLGRYVRKGEHGLAVLAPVRMKLTADDGSESWAVRGFKVEHVFAACQTDGDGEIPEPIRPTLLTGEGPRGAWDALAQLVEARGSQSSALICFLPTARLRWCLTSSRLLIAWTRGSSQDAGTRARSRSPPLRPELRLPRQPWTLRGRGRERRLPGLPRAGARDGWLQLPLRRERGQVVSQGLNGHRGPALGCAREILEQLEQAPELVAV